MTKMEQDRILLLKGKIKKDIRSIYYSKETNLYHVTFDNGKRFQYKSENVIYLLKGDVLPMPIRVTRISDSMVFQGILGVTTFLDEKRDVRAYRVVFENGEHRDYISDDILVEKHVKGEKARNVYNYLKDLSKFSHIDIDDEVTIGLFQKYDKVKMISEKSPLADYLTGKDGNIDKSLLSMGIDNSHLIFPFGCNRSQYHAVKNALCNKISVIQGPPGTGKTQTILNIIANLLISGKSITIVSNNNSAVSNVAEKMQKEKYNLFWLAAHLGSSSNKKRFYDGQTGVYPDLSHWERNDLDILSRDISMLVSTLYSGYENQEKLAKLREKLRVTAIQHEHVISTLGKDIVPLKKIRRSKDALNLLSQIDSILARKGRVGWFFKWKLRRKGITDLIEGQKSLQRTFYQRTIEELERQIEIIEPTVMSIRQNEELMEDYSLKYLHGILYKRFKLNGGKRPVFNQAEVERYNPQHFLKEYPVILSTTFSATTNINQGIPFDYIIMDEASQVDVSAGALAMNVSRNAVIVGDEKQLPNVVTLDDKIAADMLMNKYDIQSQYDFTKHSFLSSLCSLYPNIPKTMLREHYRCSPSIIEFCNQQFYEGSLIAMTDESDSPALKICTTGEGNFARGTINRRQAEMIAKEVIPELIKDYSDIGIISPYNDQVKLIETELNKEGINDIPVATVHKFQGRENDVIILSTVDNQIREFVDDPHLLNVAVSRAKKLFILVVSGNEQPDTNVKDLFEYIKYNNREIFNSRVNSVFDLLYSQKTKEKQIALAHKRKVSKFDSENLISALLEDILDKDRYHRYDFISGYPLNILIPENAPIDNIEYDFVHRSWSHVDFLIYDKVTHSPLFAIEVDGTSFHFEGSDQFKRDRIKDSALRKVGLPLLRLSTDGSGEREKIIQMLIKAIKTPVKLDMHVID